MKTLFLLLISCFFLFSISLIAQSPTTWRGPDQSGIYNESNLPDKWPEAGPEMLWDFDGLGEGYSSPAFANNHIYISGMEGSTGYVYSISQEGQLIWKISVWKGILYKLSRKPCNSRCCWRSLIHIKWHGRPGLFER